MQAAARSTRGIELLALLAVFCLESLSQASARRSARPMPLEVEQDAGGDQRTGQRAAAGLVGAGDEAGARRSDRSGRARVRPRPAALPAPALGA